MSSKPKNLTIIRATQRAEKRIDFLTFLISQKNCTDSQKLKIADLLVSAINNK
jgi:hypothetical protein